MKKSLLIGVFGLVYISTFAQLERKFQIWNKNDIVLQPWKKIEIEVAQKIHFSPQTNSVELRYAEMFLAHQYKNWLEYGGGFRISQSNSYPGWLQENRTMLILNLQKNIDGFRFKFSNRMEYRDYKVPGSHFRHKQSFTINFPSVTPLHLRFYTSEESFYKLNGNGTHLARLYGGLSTVNQEHFHLKLYYALEKYKLAEWNTRDIVGVNMTFDL